MKIDRTRTTGSHEAKKVETPKLTEQQPAIGTTQPREVKSGFTTAPKAPDTTPVQVKGQTHVASTLSLEAKPHDPDVDLGRWAEKHVGDAAGKAAPKEAQKVDDAQGAPKAKLLMCPVLGSLVKEGSLKVDDQGNVSLKELNDVMVNRLGISKPRAAVTVSTATIGNHLSDLDDVIGGKMNLNHLGGSFLDHRGQGDTGILMGGEFHEDKFQALISHSSDGKTMTIQDFSKAIKDQLKRDGGLVTRTKGASEDVFEMAALINTFGYKDENGVRRISFETMRNLYQHQQLPPKEELMARKATGVLEHFDTMAKMTRG
jgi:hypothetical protein